MLTETFFQVFGVMVKEMEKEFTLLPMALIIKDITKMIKNTVRGIWNILTEVIIWESGVKEINKEMEFKKLKMVIFMRENGLKTRDMELEGIFGQLEMFFWENFQMITSLEVSLQKKTERF